MATIATSGDHPPSKSWSPSQHPAWPQHCSSGRCLSSGGVYTRGTTNLGVHRRRQSCRAVVWTWRKTMDRQERRLDALIAMKTGEKKEWIGDTLGRDKSISITTIYRAHKSGWSKIWGTKKCFLGHQKMLISNNCPKKQRF